MRCIYGMTSSWRYWYRHRTTVQSRNPWIILGMGSANGKKRYNVTSSLIGWAHTQNDSWKLIQVVYRYVRNTNIYAAPCIKQIPVKLFTRSFCALSLLCWLVMFTNFHMDINNKFTYFLQDCYDRTRKNHIYSSSSKHVNKIVIFFGFIIRCYFWFCLENDIFTKPLIVFKKYILRLGPFELVNTMPLISISPGYRQKSILIGKPQLCFVMLNYVFILYSVYIVRHNFKACFRIACLKVFIEFSKFGRIINVRFRAAHGPLTTHVKLPVAHAPDMPGTFFPPPRVSDPDMHHGTCVKHVPCCMPGP